MIEWNLIMEMNSIEKIIDNIYTSGKVIGKNGIVKELHSAIDPDEGHFIYNIIKADPSIRTCLEVGCAYGLASLHICSALSGRTGATHTIIDPFQKSGWDGIGLGYIEQAGIDFARLIEKKSEIALPELLADGDKQYDFIFIDGWHTFDHTLLDCFYATALLRKGGILVMDDVTYPAIRRVVDFLRQYPCYEECGSVSEDLKITWKNNIARLLARPIAEGKWKRILAPGLYHKIFDKKKVQMIALRKNENDDRHWEWHADMF